MPGTVTSLFRDAPAHGSPAAVPDAPALAPGVSAVPVREGGEGAGPVDFRARRNPYFPTPAMVEMLADRLRDTLTSVPRGADAVAAELGDLLRLPPRCVVPGNGASELVAWLDHGLVRESLAVPVPTVGHWIERPLRTGKRVDMFPLQESGGFALDLARYAEFVRAGAGCRSPPGCRADRPCPPPPRRRAPGGTPRPSPVPHRPSQAPPPPSAAPCRDRCRCRCRHR